MKKNPDYMLREVAGTTVILPVGKAAVDFPGMITVNETGRQLWAIMEEEQSVESLVAWLCAQYEVDLEQARTDTENFLRRLQLVGALLDGPFEEKTVGSPEYHPDARREERR